MMQQFTEGIENVYANLDESPTDLRNQQIFDILSDMETDIDGKGKGIESGEYSQEEIVDIVTNRIGGEDATTKLGARVEAAVENFYFQLGLDSIPADRRSRDHLAYSDKMVTKPFVDETGEATSPPTRPHDRVLNAKAVPDKVEGQPWVHTDDDFILFLEWVIKQGDENEEAKYNARSIVDIISSPTDGWVVKLYQSYLAQRDREDADPLL